MFLFSLIRGIWKKKKKHLIETESMLVVAGAWGGEKGEWVKVVKGTRCVLTATRPQTKQDLARVLSVQGPGA